MTPSVDTRLHAIIGALEHVVVPALKSADPIVQEQAGLAIGHLKIIRSQLEHVNQFHLICLTEMQRTGEALLASANGGSATAQASATLAEVIEKAASRPGDVTIARDDRNDLAAAIDELIIASSIDGSAAFRQSSQNILIEHGRRQSQRDRTWYGETGLDPGRGQLGSIETMIAAEQQNEGRDTQSC